MRRHRERRIVRLQADSSVGRRVLFACWIGILLLVAACRAAAVPPPTPTPSASIQYPPPEAAPLSLSAGQTLRFDRLSLEQGLSQSTVFCMLQDSQGFLWFGTEDGLNKYDGHTFTVYKHDPDDPNSLGDNWIQALLQDDAGRIWIGTNDGLDRYDKRSGQFTHYRHDPDDPSSLIDDDINALYQDRAGGLWIGTGGGGLDRLVPSTTEGSEPETERFVHYRHDPDDPRSLSSNAVSAIYEDREGALWVGTEDAGLNRLVLSADDPSGAEGLEGETELWRRYANDPGDPHSLNHNTVTALSGDPSSALWVGMGGGGLDRFDPESERFVHYPYDPNDPGSLSSGDVAAVLIDRDGLLWIGTRDAGINWFDPERETFGHSHNVPGDPHSLSNNLILSIFQDWEGGLWFGTIGGGVNKLNMGWRNFALYRSRPGDPNSLGDNMIRAFHQDDDGTLWIGSMFGGIDRFDRESGIWTHYRHDPNDPGSLSADWVSDIYRDRSDALWIATASALDRFDPGTETFTHYFPDPDGPPGAPGNNVRTIGEDQEGVFWIGTKGGLYRFYREENRWGDPYRHDPDDPHSLSDDWVFSFAQDREGIIWIGTLGEGLSRFDPQRGSFFTYQNDPEDPHSLGSNIALSMMKDRTGTLWVGTSSGIDRLDTETDAFSHYREKDGLASDSVYCMLEDGRGHLWVSNLKGLSRFDPRTETFVNYDVADGLQSNEFNSNACLVGQNGEMFFGGINGFNAFYPDRVRDNLTVPPVVLTSLTQGGEELDPEPAADGGGEITLKWPDNAFEFEFAALSYVHPQDNQYAYYLEGFEETWNEVGTRRSGQYTNLPGGSYTLRVKGSNNDGLWNEVGTALQVTVVPSVWATWWFRGIALLALAGVAYGGYRLRVRALEARGRELESQVADRTKELAALNAVASAVSRSLNLNEILTSALSKTLEVIGFEAGGIYLLQRETQVLRIAAHEGLDASFVAEVNNLQVGEGFSGQVAETGEPLIVQDVSKDPRLTRTVARETGFHALGAVPLLSRASVMGTLFVATRSQRELSPQDVQLLAAIGDQIGVAVENARLYEQAQQVAVVEERQRMARELHDSVTQSLHSSTLMAEAGQRLASRGDLERTRHYLARLGEISQQALKEMRLMVYELRPLALRQVGLVGALQQRLDAVERRAGVDARLVVVGREPGESPEAGLRAEVEEALYRIAQEALNNVLKHARPSAVTVTLRLEDRVELEIVDDGAGFDVTDSSAGIGLHSMRERAEKLGGTLTVHSAPDEGTSIKVILP